MTSSEGSPAVPPVPAVPPADAPLRVALYSGMLIGHDAISASLRLKLEALERWKAEGVPVEAVAFVQSSDVEHPAVRVTPTAAHVLGQPGFVDADVHLFEFGIHYDLFDLVFLVPPPARVIAVWHNITPLELVDSAVVRRAIERSSVQKHNLHLADHVLCDSEFNRDDLLAFGIPAERLSVHHLPGRRATVLASKHPGRRVELLYVGRLVRAKGVAELLQAIDRLADRVARPYRLTVAGNRRFSDPTIVDQVDAAAARSGGRLRSVGEPDDDGLERLMAEADVFVIPSHHEGLCVPVIEAYEHGCQVVATDAGNLPNVVGRLGQVVPTGDVDRLVDALVRAIESAGGVTVPTVGGEVPRSDWEAAVARHLADYSLSAFEHGLRQVLVAEGQKARSVGGGRSRADERGAA